MSLRPQHPIQFLAALIAAFLLWYALAAERIENISVRNLKAPLTLANIPRDLVVVTSSVPDSVSLQLRGPLTRALDSANPPEVLLDLFPGVVPVAGIGPHVQSELIVRLVIFPASAARPPALLPGLPDLRHNVGCSAIRLIDHRCSPS
ncbi:MAG: hypothetical protein MUP13_09965, partial [Thermoanaerobaculales bacterium]|nr:hypothetical protein [Thermoanaerobaculales bacterium]